MSQDTPEFDVCGCIPADAADRLHGTYDVRPNGDFDRVDAVASLQAIRGEVWDAVEQKVGGRCGSSNGHVYAQADRALQAIFNTVAPTHIRPPDREEPV